MTSTSFTPYWRPTYPSAGDRTDPYSWVFFVVAQIAGRHRPVAVVSSTGDNIHEETILQGSPLAVACQRIVTIFADRAKHPAIRAELALAAGYYMREGDREYRPEPVKLPGLNRREHNPTLRRRPWDRISTVQFPFIAACLLQGVGFDPQKELTRAARPEPLGTVYRDTSIEWGMVVVDITKLDAVRYGIVGFAAIPMMLVTSRGDLENRWGTGFAIERGELGVFDKVRPRRAMSAAEYMTKFDHEHRTTEDENASKLLASAPLIDTAAMSLVWPPGPGLEDDILPSLVNLSVGTPTINRSLLDLAITSLVQSTFDIDEFDMSIFDEVRIIPGFQDLLWRKVLEHSARLGSTRSAGQLIRLAFADQEHLGLEQLNNLSSEAISAALSVLEMGKITSISFCIDSIRSTPAQLINVLSRTDTLREIYFLQSPMQESDALSAQFFEELAAQPQILLRAKFMLAGAYSAALRKRFWLPTIPKSIGSNSVKTVQVAPLGICLPT